MGFYGCQRVFMGCEILSGLWVCDKHLNFKGIFIMVLNVEIFAQKIMRSNILNFTNQF